jgi:hypothetical protein
MPHNKLHASEHGPGGADEIAAEDITMAKVGSPTYYTVQDMQNIVHSCGWVSGGVISCDVNGIDVTAGEGLMRVALLPAPLR